MTKHSDAVGSVRSSNAQRTALALESINFNMRDRRALPPPPLPPLPPLTPLQDVLLSLFRSRAAVAAAAGGARQQLKRLACAPCCVMRGTGLGRGAAFSVCFAAPYIAAHSSSAGVAEVLDTQAAAAASSPLAIVFTVTLASAVLYIALT